MKHLPYVVALSISTALLTAKVDPDWFKREEAAFAGSVLGVQLEQYYEQAVIELAGSRNLLKQAYFFKSQVKELTEDLQQNADYSDVLYPTYQELLKIENNLKSAWTLELAEKKPRWNRKLKAVLGSFTYLKKQMEEPWEDNLQCRKTRKRSYLPQKSTGVWIGSESSVTGPSKKECQALIAQHKNGLICSWSGKGFLPYKISDGLVIGGSQSGGGFSDLSLCVEAIKGRKEDTVCSYNGKAYLPYRVFSASAIGGDASGHGFGNLKLCSESIEVQKQGLVCSWTGKAYLPHRIDSGERIGNKSGYGFPKVGDCHEVVKHAGATTVCSWSGKAYHLYHISDGFRTVKSFGSNEKACFTEVK